MSETIPAPTSFRPGRGSSLGGLHPAVLIGTYVAIAIIPLILAVLQGRPPRSFWRELSTGLVMIGFAAMMLQFLLSGRFRHISGRVGIDRTMRFHQLIAWSVLAFISLHPILYAVPRLQDGPGSALAALTRMFTSPGLRSGVLAWLVFLLLVPLAVQRDRLPVRYEIWRLSHGLGAAAIAGLGLHHTLRVGTYSDDLLLAAFWIVLVGSALFSLAYIYVFKPLLQLRSPCRVIGNRKVADRTWEVSVMPERGEAPRFAAGQFVWLNLGHSPFSLTEHPFSISSAPAERPRLAFTIKESGDFTDTIGEVAVGTTVYLDGPHGSFTLGGRGNRPIIFIAGGVGFAPIIGMLRQLASEGHRHPIHLIYGNRVETQILYHREIESLHNRLDLRVDLVLSEPPHGWSGRTGQITPDVLRTCLDVSVRDALYLVCGPVPMMNLVENTLIQMGVPPGAILSERFRYD